MNDLNVTIEIIKEGIRIAIDKNEVILNEKEIHYLIDMLEGFRKIDKFNRKLAIISDKKNQISKMKTDIERLKENIYCIEEEIRRFENA